MAAVEVLEIPGCDEVAPHLRLVSAAPARRARLAERRLARARARRRRHRALAAVALAGALAVLCVPGRVFGATTPAGLPGDLAGSGTLAAGQSYVVRPGDTVTSIARLMNPNDPARARALVVRELGTSVVVAGEHVRIP